MGIIGSLLFSVLMMLLTLGLLGLIVLSVFFIQDHPSKRTLPNYLFPFCFGVGAVGCILSFVWLYANAVLTFNTWSVFAGIAIILLVIYYLGKELLLLQKFDWGD